MRCGPESKQIPKSDGTLDSIAVASTGVAYSKAFPLSYGESFALSWQCTSDGTVAVDIDLEQSLELPATEGASDSNFVIPDGISTIASETDENVHHKSLSPLPIKWARLKFTGTGSNHATTVIKAWISQVEEV